MIKQKILIYKSEKNHQTYRINIEIELQFKKKQNTDV